MNKMKLVLEDLQVESFAVQADEMERGTVRGLQVDSGIHSHCYTHCPTDCEGSCACESRDPTHCNADETCYTWDGTCDHWNGSCWATGCLPNTVCCV